MTMILTHQFQVSYVYRYSSRDLELGYLVSTFWAGQEGSFLLWAMLIALMGVVLTRTARQFETHAMLVVNLVQGFFLLILMKANPLALSAQVPPDGAGLNPLLQNPWMVIHPPILFIGYAAATIPFALAIAALARKDHIAYLRQVLPWVLFTSLTLGAGIIIGGYWAYKVLGWGGYWGWDPVENSSLIPWLTSLALLHGLLVQRKMGALPKTNLLLAIITFVLVLYATFLTRSGILQDFSVHSFQDLGINSYLIAFMASTMGLGLWVFKKYYRSISFNELKMSLQNRESVLVASMMVFGLSAFLTFVGTSSPIFTGLMGQPAQVDISFYNTVHLPIGIFLALFLGFAPYLRWQLTEGLLKTLLPSIALTILSSAAAYLAGLQTPLQLLFAAATLFAFWSNLMVTVKLIRINWRFASAPLSHVGVGLMLLGVIISAAFEKTEQVALEKGKPTTVMGYELTYSADVPVANGKNIVNINVSGDRDSYVAQPRFYYSEYNRGAMREPDVRAGFLTDLYIAPLEQRDAHEGHNHNTLIIRKGETKTIADLAVHFSEFEMSDHSGSGAFKVGAKLDVTAGESHYAVTPALIYSGDQQKNEAGILTLNTDGQAREVTVSLNRMDANQKVVELVFDGLEDTGEAVEGQTVLIVEVSQKPFMSVLWLGTIILTIGTAIALSTRIQARRETPPPLEKKRSKKQKKVPAATT